MPWLIAALIGGLSRFVPYIVAKVLTAVGLGVVTFTSLNYLLSQLTNTMSSLIYVADVTSILQYSGILPVANLLVSAYTVRITLDAARTVVQKV